jgi:hypothetical protein
MEVEARADRFATADVIAIAVIITIILYFIIRGCLKRSCIAFACAANLNEMVKFFYLG